MMENNGILPSIIAVHRFGGNDLVSRIFTREEIIAALPIDEINSFYNERMTFPDPWPLSRSPHFAYAYLFRYLLLLDDQNRK